MVTGGNGELGQRICHALAAQGFTSPSSCPEQGGGGLAYDLEKHQVGAAANACDVTKRDEVQRMVDDVVKRFGRLDILVNDTAYNKRRSRSRISTAPHLHEEWTDIRIRLDRSRALCRTTTAMKAAERRTSAHRRSRGRPTQVIDPPARFPERP